MLLDTYYYVRSLCIIDETCKKPFLCCFLFIIRSGRRRVQKCIITEIFVWRYKIKSSTMKPQSFSLIILLANWQCIWWSAKGFYDSFVPVDKSRFIHDIRLSDRRYFFIIIIYNISIARNGIHFRRPWSMQTC